MSAICYIQIKICDLFLSAAPEDNHETKVPQPETILYPNLELHFGTLLPSAIVLCI